MQISKPIYWLQNRAERFLRRSPSDSQSKCRQQERGMKTFISLFLIGALLAVVAGCATAPPARQTETLLVAANFKTVAATTPAQRAHLKTMTPGKFALVKRNDKTYYVYPDAVHNQLYVGSQNQYQSFYQSYQDEQLSNDRIQGAGLQEDAIFWDLWAETDFAN
jgi:hypothetical protein